MSPTPSLANLKTSKKTPQVKAVRVFTFLKDFQGFKNNRKFFFMVLQTLAIPCRCRVSGKQQEELCAMERGSTKTMDRKCYER